MRAAGRSDVSGPGVVARHRHPGWLGRSCSRGSRAAPACAWSASTCAVRCASTSARASTRVDLDRADRRRRASPRILEKERVEAVLHAAFRADPTPDLESRPRARDDRQPARAARVRRGEGAAARGGVEHDALRPAPGQSELPLREPPAARPPRRARGARPRRDGGAARRAGASAIPTSRSRCCARAGSSGPTFWNRVVRYFALPVVPMPLGYDPLLQLVHEEDACAPSSRPRCAPHPGVFNVVGSGVLPLSTLLRLAGKRALRAAVAAALPARRTIPSQGQTGDPPAAFYDYLRYLWVADGRSGWDAFGEPALLDEGGLDLLRVVAPHAALPVSDGRERSAAAERDRRGARTPSSSRCARRSPTCAASCARASGRGGARDAEARRVDWNELLRLAAPRGAAPSACGALGRGRRVRHGRGRAAARAPAARLPLRPLLARRPRRASRICREQGPCLLVANHSGLLPYDGLMLAHAVERVHASGERPRFSSPTG